MGALRLCALTFDPKEKGLRSNALKRERELAEASLFCYGLSCRMGQPIWGIDHEDSDYVAALAEAGYSIVPANGIEDTAIGPQPFDKPRGQPA